ncbi:restriction endonuclease subunit S [Shewanella putrefaciens]|uniref:Restriction modification system DNA specificity domain protein n=2 Tax=Gammaproteobacteria TaxID=1236 RepID=E6XGX2_SHEP2|nr:MULTISPECIES: restriction endonuclease subunit S [unclassified Shewanella]MCK7632298.1 restriction endonuclease subunit S [Shewanella sp. JNE9-1]MCK7655603.1 restriction endonuclease subunit S [Shewanella sp. JNE4-1]VEE60864.1 Type I restriction enzyme specificity protein MPN_089 [Shewanella putrefaciens]
MSYLSFIEKLFEGGDVEWKELGNSINFQRGKRLVKSQLEESGEYAVFQNSMTPLGYYHESNVSAKSAFVICAGAAGEIGFSDDSFWAADDVYYAEQSEILNSKYLYHFLLTQKHKIASQVRRASIPRLSKSAIEKLIVPIPCPDNPEKSLAIQAEIVRILDAFTAMTAELTAELNMRKKQYNYYRDQLLSFEEGEVEWRALSEMAEYSKARISYTELDDSNYVGVESLLQNRAGKIDSTRTPDSGNLTQYNPDDILIGNIRPYLKKIWHADRVGGTNGDVLVVHPTDTAINPRYLYQVLADDKFFEYNMQHAKGAKMPRGNKPKIMEYLVPIPFASNREKSLSEQERIVTILDKFDTLTSSITEGLPREIELRQKQYEYYRDLLLSFPKSHSDEAA